MRPIQRLRAWARENDGSLTFGDRRGHSGVDPSERWGVSAERPIPVRLSFGATGATVDEAAGKLIELLLETGEEIPDD